MYGVTSVTKHVGPYNTVHGIVGATFGASGIFIDTTPQTLLPGASGQQVLLATRFVICVLTHGTIWYLVHTEAPWHVHIISRFLPDDSPTQFWVDATAENSHTMLIAFRRTIQVAVLNTKTIVVESFPIPIVHGQPQEVTCVAWRQTCDAVRSGLIIFLGGDTWSFSIHSKETDVCCFQSILGNAYDGSALLDARFVMKLCLHGQLDVTILPPKPRQFAHGTQITLTETLIVTAQTDGSVFLFNWTKLAHTMQNLVATKLQLGGNALKTTATGYNTFTVSTSSGIVTTNVELDGTTTHVARITAV